MRVAAMVDGVYDCCSVAEGGRTSIASVLKSVHHPTFIAL